MGAREDWDWRCAWERFKHHFRGKPGGTSGPIRWRSEGEREDCLMSKKEQGQGEDEEFNLGYPQCRDSLDIREYNQTPQSAAFSSSLILHHGDKTIWQLVPTDVDLQCKG